MKKKLQIIELYNIVCNFFSIDYNQYEILSS